MRRAPLFAAAALTFLATQAVSQTVPEPLRVTRIYGITNGTTIDNRSSLRQNNNHTFCATGTGTWSVQLQHGDTSSGPWTNFSTGLVANTSTSCAGSGVGYYAWLKFVITGSATATYSGARDFFGGSGLTGDFLESINGMTDAAQTIVAGSAGTDFAVSSANGVTTLNLPTASATNRGALSSADWSTFNSKEPPITGGTTAQVWRGDKTFVTLNTSIVPESGSLYYTDARARGALSGTSPISYSSATGVFSCPTCVVDTGSYANPSWITSLAWGKLTGVPSTFAPTAHASSHQNGGTDEVATATPGANVIPKAGSDNKLAVGFIPSLPASIITSGTITGDIRIDGTTATIETGAALPGTCNPGPPPDVFIRTSDNSIHRCSATDTWTQVSGGAGGGDLLAANNLSDLASASAARTNLGLVIDTDVLSPATAASTYLALAGGTLTGQVVTDNLGIEFTESDTNPTCAAGNFNIYADLSENKLKKCENGTASDFGDGGVGGGTPGGSDQDIQINNAGSFAGRAVGTGLAMDATTLGIDTSVVPQKGATNTFSAAQTFTSDLTASGVGSDVDLSGANSTLPIKAGTTPPATCVASKEMFIDTDASSGDILLLCNSSGNGWDGMDGGGGGGLGDPGSNGIVKRTALNTTAAASAGTDYVSPGSATTYTAGIKQTFQANATTAGVNVACSALPSSPANGDIACDSGDSNKIKLRSNGAWVDPGSGSGGYTPSILFNPFWNVQNQIGTAVIFGAANRSNVYPVQFPYPVTLTKIIFEVTTGGGAGAGLRIGLWNEARDTLLIDSGALSGSTVETPSSRSVTISEVTVPAGDYYLTITSDSTTLQMRTCVSTAIWGMANAGTTRVGFADASSNSGASIAFPPAMGSITANSNQTPCIFFAP